VNETNIKDLSPNLTVPALLATPALLTAVLLLANCGTENLPATPSSGGATMAGSSPGGSASSAGAAGSSAVAGGGGAGLGGSGGTSTAGAAGSSGGGGSGGGAIEPTFSMLKGVIQTSCFGSVCHDLSEHTLPLKVDDKLYTTLTTHMTKTCGPVVKPGSPQDSALVKLLKGPCGETDRMPYGKCNQDGDEGCISPEIIAAIEKWIANGAPP
jgi:hypothetical protein